jgi:PPOX class probable F420-dependent enzyme
MHRTRPAELGDRGGRVDPDDARQFVAGNHRAVLVTRRSGGGLQTSPVLVGVDDEGKVVISTREGAFKTRNLRRDPTAVLCVFSDGFFGRWMQIEGTAQVVSLPEAMDGLVDYYRRIGGEHPDWEDYRRAMRHQQRVLVRVSIDKVGPTHAG